MGGGMSLKGGEFFHINVGRWYEAERWEEMFI